MSVVDCIFEKVCHSYVLFILSHGSSRIMPSGIQGIFLVRRTHAHSDYIRLRGTAHVRPCLVLDFLSNIQGICFLFYSGRQ